MISTILLIATFINVTFSSGYSNEKLQLINREILSRRKRYVVFPEGSSFQLVYCLTMPTFGMGQLFTIGLTAGLAWELPHEPIDFKNKENSETADNRVDKRTNVTNYRPWNEAIFNIYPYKSYKIQPVNNNSYKWSKPNVNIWHGNKPAYRNDYLYRQHGEIHRRTRRDLFQKIESFFQALNKDGKACLLKALCEVNQKTGPYKKGTFVEEILRAIFTWKDDDNQEQFEDYNVAASYKRNCTEKYSACSHSVWDTFL